MPDMQRVLDPVVLARGGGVGTPVYIENIGLDPRRGVPLAARTFVFVHLGPVEVPPRTWGWLPKFGVAVSDTQVG